MLSIISLPTILALFFIASPQQGTAEESFRAYVAAMNSHDVERAVSFYADDLVCKRKGEKRECCCQKKQLRAFREWEIPMEARFDYKVLQVSGDRITVEIVEFNRFHEALGVERPVTEEYLFRDGLIREINTLNIRDAKRPLSEAIKEFEEWLAEKPSKQLAGLMKEGHLIYDGEAARKLLPFLEEWQQLRR
jgi:hypothetical protein